MADKYWNELDKLEQQKYDNLIFDSIIKEFFRTGNFNYQRIQHNPKKYTENVVYNSEVEFKHSHFGQEINFIDCYFLSDVKLTGYTAGTITFTRCVIEGELSFHLRSEEHKPLACSLIDILVRKQILINKGVFSVFRVSVKRFPLIVINGGTFKELSFGYWGRSEIKEIFFDVNKIDGILKIYQSQIEKVQIFGTNNESEIYFENIEVNSFNLYRFRNESKLRIQNITPFEMKEKKTEVVIYDSNLNKVEFYDTDFRNFNDIIFHDSFITETVFVNVDWPKKIAPYGGQYISKEEKEFKSETIYSKKAKDNYRQIKYALSKQGDVINEHYFHGLEMIEYNKTLELSWKNLSTKTIISLSYWLSDFGQSLWRPFLALFAFNGLLYFLMILVFNYQGYRVSYDNANWNDTINVLAEFFRLINPLHRNEPELRGCLLIFDITIRIWSSYMIYNLVRASRRFLK